MNLKNKICALVLVMSAFHVNAIEVSPEIYQSYQRIQNAIGNSPERAIPEVIQFYKYAQNQSDTVKLLAGNLYLDNCMRLKDYPCALQRIQEILQLELTTEQVLNFNLLGAQLSYQQSKYPLTSKFLRNWLPAAKAQLKTLMQEKSEKVSSIQTQLANNYIFSAHAYLQQEKTKLAIRDVLDAMNIEQRGENDYRLLLSLYEKSEQKDKARALLITMTKLFPANGNYWERLGYNYLENQQAKEALKVLGAAYHAEILPDRSWILLAQLYMNQSAPHKAIPILERGLKEQKISDQKALYKLLTNANLLGRDHIAALKTFSEMEKHQPLTTAQMVQKAQIAFRLGKWRPARHVLTTLVDDNPDNAQWRFMLAISLYELGNYQESIKQLRLIKAPEYDVIVQQWLKQIDYLAS